MTKEEALQKARTKHQTEYRKQWLFNALSLKINNTMDYELAMQLKKAGFPQKNNPKDVEFAFKHFKKESVYIPNLEEVIEECGNSLTQRAHRFEFYLMYSSDAWYATYSDESFKRPEQLPDCQGSTPSEAVARLWLVLQDKNK